MECMVRPARTAHSLRLASGVMAKRKSGSDDDSPHRKRQKITKQSEPPQELDKIETSKDLQRLLAFEQDAGPHIRQRYLSFKSFLDSIAYGKESDERSARRVILLEYLQSQTANDREAPSTHPVPIVQTWHFATQGNVESLFSSVAAVLALLLKTISTLVDFRDCGNHLCRFLLQDDQIQLFDRGLSANTAKEHLISPCLRLLTEIVSFDGGHSARIVFRQREIAFKRLETFLSMRKSFIGEGAEGRQRPSIRNNALRYLYANLRLQASAAKIHLLTHGKVLRAVFEDISEDSPTVILELLEVLKKDVASDSALPHTAKSRFFNEWALSRLVTLYKYAATNVTAEGRVNVYQAAHEFLLYLCTSPGYGVLGAHGEHNTESEDGKPEDRPKTELDFGHSFRRDDRPTGKNIKLALFLQSLRPYASVLQSELILAVFQIAPVMVSDYFARKKTFTFDPKATATWIGYSSFLLATVQLPLPRTFTVCNVNTWAPPPYSKVIDSIMPEPMTQRVMTRCLNQDTDLIKFLSTKLLTAAFEKLAEVLRIYRGRYNQTDQNRDSGKWDQAALEIIAEFCSRIPDIEHIVAQLRGCSSESAVLRESLTRLLLLYYVVIPQVALGAKFDVSIALSAALQGNGPDVGSQAKNGVRILELNHILDIAKRSPNIQWWHKSERMSLSPFTTLLKLHVDRRQVHTDSRQLRTLLVSVIQEYQFLDFSDGMLSLDVLVLTLQDSDQWKASNTVFEFLDNCILRLVRKPVHYYDTFSNLVAATASAIETTDTHIDLLLIAIMEQWPFLAKTADEETVTNVATWLVRYIESTWLRMRIKDGAGLHRGFLGILAQIRDNIAIVINNEACRSVLDRTLSDPPELGLSIESATDTSIREQERDEKPRSRVESREPEPCVNQVPPGPPEEHDDHPGLNRWTRENILDAMSDGAIEELLLCLCSKYAEIRQQAIASIGTFMAKLEASGYSEWQQTYVVAGELVETAKDATSGNALPYIAGVLAARLLSVVADPLHIMYEKVNKFLHKGPRWNVAKLPSYWVDKILLNPPTGDDAHYHEAEWLLDVLIDGLRTPADFAVYYGCRIFERILSFSASPSIPKACLQRIVALLFRCTYVEGSSTLITRCGLIGWIASRLALRGSPDGIDESLELLASTVYQTSDKGRVNSWSHGTLSATLENIRKLKS